MRHKYYVYYYSLTTPKPNNTIDRSQSNPLNIF
ncbi:hypothetical protein PSEUDO8AS_60025 [Pseudomonas sp. 8AS]|nr:hypothetical protein PSEUDO8AS_60025 [Pseudomonas sp. 8AS]